MRPSLGSPTSTEVDGSLGKSFNSRVADQIQPASSGRSKCRGCGRNIASGELRFGESLPNAYGEGEALHWFHLLCAACMRAEKFLPALEAAPSPLPDQAWLREAAEFGIAHDRVPRLLRAERAASGRARCRSCREAIDKGAWRLSLQMFEEGRFSPIGTIHVDCAEPYFGTADILERVRRLTPELEPRDLVELEALLNTPRPQPAAAAEDDATPAESPTSPGLAKAAATDEPVSRRARR